MVMRFALWDIVSKLRIHRLKAAFKHRRTKLYVFLSVCFILALFYTKEDRIEATKWCENVYIVDKADITVNSNNGWDTGTTGAQQDMLFSLNCDDIIRGDQREINHVEDQLPCIRREIRDEDYYVEQTKDCNTFIHERGYFDHPVREEETIFPIAFNLLMFDHVEQAERLLRAIYRPQNIYCIHVDASSSAKLHHAMLSISNCFDNVVVASELIDVQWGMFTVLEAELSCMKTLFQYKNWKYLINLTGQEFPLKTNWELVQILKAYNGGNDVKGFTKGRPESWTALQWYSPNLPLPILKSNPPHGYVIHKGPTHIAVTRDFVDFALHNNTALDLLDWMKTMKMPDEHYFHTLNHNPKFRAPGSFTGYPENKTTLMRYKVWQVEGGPCSGTWAKAICMFGAGDLQRLVKSKALFANKLRLDQNPVALHCMEKWYYNRVRKGNNEDFDIEFYRSMPWVKHHV